MKLTRLRAQALAVLKTVSTVVALLLSAVFPADAQDQSTLVELVKPVTVNGINCRYRLDGILPSSSTTGEFSLWREMHPHTFDGKLSSYVAQCKSTIGKPSWLTSKVCAEFGTALAQGNCAVVPDVNNIRLDVVRGKINGKSTAFLNEHMRLGEPRQAVFVPLPGDLWLGVFAGEPGKSCNNFFALKRNKPLVFPKPVTKLAIPTPLPEPIPPSPSLRVMVHTGAVQASSVQYLPSVYLESCCKGCQVYVPSHVIVTDDGANLKSQGYSQVDW
jgi:hypothetical protein